MNIANLKKKIIGISIAFLLVGAVIILVGFGMADFQTENLEQKGNPRWYQTIHVEDKSIWWSVGPGWDR